MIQFSNNKFYFKHLSLIVIVFTLTFISLSVTSLADDRIYTLSIIPMYAHEITFKYYSPFMEYLKKETGKKWVLKFYNTHDDLIDSFCKGHIDIAFSGPAPFIDAQKKCKAKILLTSLESNNKPYYNAVIIASNKNIKTIKDIKGLRFGYIKGSTLAHIVPFAMLEKEGIQVNPVRYKRQEEIVKGVLTGEIDSGGVKKSVIDNLKEQNLHIIATSEDIPNFLFFAQPNLNDNLRKIFISALIKLKPLQDKNHRKITEKWADEVKYGFLLPDDEYLRRVSQLSVWHQRFTTP